MTPPIPSPPGLAIETSGRGGSVALMQDGRVLAEDRFPQGLKHAAELIPRIDALLKQTGLRPVDLRELYVSVGPGSFTGLRIGITLAKTLAFVTGARIIPVSSVRVLAENAPPEARHVIIVLDAKRGQIFTARFERVDVGWIERESARLSDLTTMLARSPRPVHLLGEGIPYHRNLIPKNDPEVIETDESLWAARAPVVGMLGSLPNAQALATPDELLPLYIRLPEAVEKLDAQK